MMRPSLSLVGRITMASTLAAAAGGTGSALSAGVTARELGAKHESAQLKSAAQELADELHEELFEEEDNDDEEENLRRSPEALLLHELADVKIEGAHAALWLGDSQVAGDTALPALSHNECRQLEHASRALRACSVRVGDKGLLTLVASTDAERARSMLLFRALLVGILGGAALGALLSYALARWAIAPLTLLRDRVRSVRVDESLPERLGSAVPQLEVEELRSAVASLVERLGEALVHAQAFAAEAAHELRTPLTTIAGELELLEDAGPTPDPAALARVRAQVADLTMLVQRLLVLAQPTRLEPNLSEVVDLADVLSAVRDAIPIATRARIHDSAADDVLVRGDATLLRALLSNAVDNALKFSSGQVEVSIARSHEQACIDVLDEGPGLSVDEQKRVFAPFYRSPSVRASTQHGHGLGLALIARVAFRHGGQAEFLERPRGAHLRISLPLLQVQPSVSTRVQTRGPGLGD